MTPELAKDARKAFIEPAAAWIGQEGLRRLVRAVLERASKSQSNQDASR